MASIHISKIIISENRQRQEFAPEALQELKNSIEDRGLMHPPVLRKTAEGYVLVAGERRLRAIKEIFELGGAVSCGVTAAGKPVIFHNGMVPFLDLGELSDLDAEEAELDENLKRKDLTWQEHAGAVKRLHELRQAQKAKEGNDYLAGMAAAGFVPDAAAQQTYTQTIADTAEELTGRRDGSYQDTVRKEILVARHLSNPAIAKAKSADEAFKLLKREEERQKNIALAIKIGETFTTDAHTLWNGDCLEWMRRAENAGRFDVICTDPPYGMDAESFGDAGGKLTGITHSYDDSKESWEALMRAWAPLTWTVTKPQAHLYAFCDFDNFHELKSLLQTAGWYVFRTPIILHKINSGRVPLPEMGPRRQWEMVLYAIKGKKPVTHIYPDMLSVNGDENLFHGAQKPVAAFSNLLQRSVHPGDEVLDCFAGTGSIIPAGHLLKCRVTAIEQVPEYYSICAKRLVEINELN